jgi:hypothetical protein
MSQRILIHLRGAYPTTPLRWPVDLDGVIRGEGATVVTCRVPDTKAKRNPVRPAPSQTQGRWESVS